MTNAAPEPHACDEGLAPGRRRLAMLCILTSSAMCVLATSLVAVALPTIARDLGATVSASVWVVNAFQLAVAASILAFSGLGALIGLRRVFIGGLACFTLASLACALCESLVVLAGWRFVQGLGAAAVICTSPAFFRMIYPARLLGRALGQNALVVAVTMAVGPMVGGLIVDRVPWVWIFAANVPIGLIALWFARRSLPFYASVRRGYDLRGAISSAIGVSLLILAADQLRQPGGLRSGGLLFVGAVVFLHAFLQVQRTARAPLLPPDLLLLNRRLALAAGSSLFANTGQGLTLIALPFLLQLDYGFSPGESGLLLTAMPVAMMFAAPASGSLADRHGGGLLMCAGLLTVALSLASFLLLDPAMTGRMDLLVRIFLCGLGFGLFQTPNNREFIESVDRTQVGSASGLLSFTRNMGLTLGATFLSTAMALYTSASGATDISAALHVGLLAASVAFLLASGISALRFRSTTTTLPL